MNNRTAIISTRKLPVATSFEGEECLVIRRIITRINDNNKRIAKFIIQTDSCNYYEEDVPDLDAEGNVQYDAEGVTITKKVNKLKIVRQLGEESVRYFKYDVIDVLASQIESLIPQGVTQTQKDNIQEQLALLNFTKHDVENDGNPPYATTVDDWRIMGEDEWEIDIA